MADTLLDYGVPDGAGGDAQGTMEASYENNPVVDPGEVHLQDAGMDAEMQEWEDKYEGTAEDYEAHRQRKVDELLASRRTKFYALPRDQAVQAGAQRGVGALPALAEDDLVGEESERLALCFQREAWMNANLASPQWTSPYLTRLARSDKAWTSASTLCTSPVCRSHSVPPLAFLHS